MASALNMHYLRFENKAKIKTPFFSNVNSGNVSEVASLKNVV